MAAQLQSDPVQAHTSTPSSIPGIRRIASIFALLVLVFVVGIAVNSWRDARAEATTDLGTVAELGSRAVNDYFSYLGRDLRSLGDDLAAAGRPLDLGQAHARVKRFHDQRPELFNVTLIAPDGAVLFSAKFPPGSAAPATLAREPSFLAYLNELTPAGSTLAVGQPLVGVSSQVVIVPVRYGVRDSQGQLAFIVSANLPHEYLRSFWMDAPITGRAAIGLMRDNGFLLSRYPIGVAARADLAQVYGKPRTGALIDHLRKTGFPARGQVTGASSTDGNEVMFVFRRLKDFPVTLFVALPTSELRNIWFDRTGPTALAVLLLGIGCAGGYRYAIRSQLALERKQERLEAAQRKADTQFRLMADSAPVLIWIAGTDKQCFWVNQVWLDFTGRTLAQEVGNGWTEGIHADDQQRRLDTYDSAFDARRALSMEYRLRRFDGEYRWLLDHGVPRFDGDESFQGYIGSCIDITDRKAAEQALSESAALLRRSEAQMATSQRLGGTGSWAYDVDTQGIQASAQSLVLFGLAPGDGARPLADFLACIPEREQVQQVLLAAITERRPYEDEYAVQPADGSPPRFIHAIGTLEMDAQGKVARVVGFIQDITDRRRAEERLAASNALLGSLAVRDALTGLFNRRYLDEVIQVQFAEAQRTGQPLSVLMLDLDHFKQVNDRQGHWAGDCILSSMGRLLAAGTREQDVACRYGGDEFLLVLPRTSSHSAAQRAEEIRARVEALVVPYEATELRMTISVGVATCPGDSASAEALLRSADAALYAAKVSGRNCVRPASPGPR